MTHFKGIFVFKNFYLSNTYIFIPVFMSHKIIHGFLQLNASIIYYVQPKVRCINSAEIKFSYTNK